MNNRVNLPVKKMYYHMKFHQNFIFSIDIKYISSTKKKKKNAGAERKGYVKSHPTKFNQ